MSSNYRVGFAARTVLSVALATALAAGAIPAESRRPVRTFKVRNRGVKEVLQVVEDLLRAGVTYTHTDNGNRVISDGGTGTGAAPKCRYTYDAWNRLVLIEKYNTATTSYDVMNRSDYDGLHWRTRKLAPVTPGSSTSRETFYTYNAAWQAIVEEIDSDHTSSSSQIDRLVHQVFGLRGVNDAIFRREDVRRYYPAVDVYVPCTDPETMEETECYDHTEPAYYTGPDGVFEKSIFQLADAQGSVVSVITAKAWSFTDDTGTARAYGAGRTLETLEYDPYGRSRNISLGGFDHTGTLTVQDIFDFENAWFAGNAAGDQNDNGTLEVQDIFDFLNDWFLGGTTVDAMSASWIDNPYGYCGYYAEKETLGINGARNGFLYQCRFRVYDPITGRWMQRDPAGFISGLNLYEYISGRPISEWDELGLWPDWLDDYAHNFVEGAKEVAESWTGPDVGHNFVEGAKELVSPESQVGQTARRAVAGALVTVVTMGAAAPALAAMGVEGAIAGGAIVGATTGALTNAVDQGLRNLDGTQHGFNWWEFGGTTAGGALLGAGLGALTEAFPVLNRAWYPFGGAPGGTGYRVMSPDEYAGARNGNWEDSGLVRGDPSEQGHKWLWGNRDGAESWLKFVQGNGEDSSFITQVPTAKPLAKYPAFDHPPQGPAFKVPIPDLGPASIPSCPPPQKH